MVEVPNMPEKAPSRSSLPLKLLVSVGALLLPTLILIGWRRSGRREQVVTSAELAAAPEPIPVPAAPEAAVAVPSTEATLLPPDLEMLRLTESDRRNLRRLLVGVVICLPFLMLYGLLYLTHHATLSSYVPYLSDEVYYWRQFVSFQTVGFNTGYFTYGEQMARLGTYYSWGIFTPMFVGIVARIFGWTLYSIPLLSAVLMSAALAVFVRVVKPDLERLAWLLLGLILFFPLLLYHVTSMMETMLYALAVMIAAALYGLMKTPRPSRGLALFGLIVLLIATLMRPTIGLLFIPYCLLLQRRNTLFSIGAALVLGGVLWLGTWYVYSLTAAPYPAHILEHVLEVLPSNPAQALQMVTDHANENLHRFFQGELPEIFQRVQMLVVIGVMGATLILGFLRLNRRFQIDVPALEALFHVYNFGLILLLYILLNDISVLRDYRGLAPHVLVSLLLLVALRRRVWLAAFVVSGLLFLPQVNTVYVNWSEQYLSPQRHAAYSEWQDKLAAVLVYEPNASTPWCNTVLHLGRAFDDPTILLALPPQFAISFVLDAGEVSIPAKSRYFLVDTAAFVDHPDRFAHVQPLLDVPGGKLLLNLDSACGQGGTS